MAGKKNSRSSKTDHVLSLLTDSSPEPAAGDTPSAPESQPVETVSAPVPERHLTPPILEVARTNNEALEETIHSALEDALKEELAQEKDTAPALSQPEVPGGGNIPADGITHTEEHHGGEETVPSARTSPAAAPEEVFAEQKTPYEAQENAPAEQEIPASSEENPPAEQGSSSTTPKEALADESTVQSLPYYRSLPDGNRFVNVMLPLVEETLERYVTLFHLCSCPRCLADAQALALSRLPAKYVVLSEAAFTPMMSLYRAKYDSQITTQVIYACKQIMDAPRH